MGVLVEISWGMGSSRGRGCEMRGRESQLPLPASGLSAVLLSLGRPFSSSLRLAFAASCILAFVQLNTPDRHANTNTHVYLNRSIPGTSKLRQNGMIYTMLASIILIAIVPENSFHSAPRLYIQFGCPIPLHAPRHHRVPP
jgi:hypothetical protein